MIRHTHPITFVRSDENEDIFSSPFIVISDLKIKISSKDVLNSFKDQISKGRQGFKVLEESDKKQPGYRKGAFIYEMAIPHGLNERDAIAQVKAFMQKDVQLMDIDKECKVVDLN